MPWPRKGILIRLLIYGPIIGFLSYQALEKYRTEREVTETDVAGAEPPSGDDVEDKLEPYKKVIEMPDGTKQEIIQLTPEQAEEILGHPLPEHKPDSKSDSKAAD